jgi:dynein heavy chain, axonemal
MPTTRQRGFYSEVLDAEMDESAAHTLLQSAACGPHEEALQPRFAAPKQRVPMATQFGGAGEEAVQAAAAKQAKLLSQSTSAPSRALEPKVLVPFKPGIGKTPRRIVVERQKRLFALQDLAQLLLDLGIDSAVPDPPNALPLELFDNTEYECRPVGTWLAMAEPADDGSKFLPCLFLRPPSEGGKPALWTEGQVQSFDAKAQRFTVLFRASVGGPLTATIEVHRIQLCFRAEDPFIFTRRVAAAYAAREAAEAAIRYQLYIECMPIEELPTMEKERVSRMLALALCTPKLRENKLNASSLVNEVQLEYSRTMSAIIFEQRSAAAAAAADAAPLGVLPGPGGDAMFSLVVPAPEVRKPVPESALVEVPAHECLHQKQGFAFHTFFSKPEIIACSQKVRSECNKVLAMTLLSTGFTKSFTDEEIAKEQTTVLAATVAYLKDTWTNTLKSIVRNGLKDVGKGWFNLQEKSTEVYAMSKLKGFLRMVNFMMQDCVIFMAEASIRSYADFVIARSGWQVTVTSPSEVTRTPRLEAVPFTHLPPLFTTSLLVKDGEGVSYSIQPQAFIDTMLEAYDKAVGSVQDLPQLEKLVMESLFWSHTPMLQTISRGEGLALTERERFNEVLQKALPPMAEYLALYDKYNDSVRLNLEQYLIKYAEQEKSITEMQTDVKKELAKIDAIESSIPASVVVGMFAVNTMAVRKELVDKHRAIANATLSLIMDKVKMRRTEVTEAFAAIQRSLNRGLSDVEQVAELEEYVQNLPNDLAALEETLATMQMEQAILDDFQFPTTEDDFKKFYKTLSWPKMIDDVMNAALERCTEKRQEYVIQQQAEQDAFGKSLNKLEKVVSEFGKYTDLTKVNEVSKVVKNLQAELKEAEQQKLLFNKRESIFGTPMTDYSQLGKTIKAFEPFANLWNTASNWVNWQRDWLEGPFIKLDPEDMEKELSNASRTMFKLVKQFDGVPGLGDISQTIKAEIEEFLPVMPLVLALRNPGMRERHWLRLTADTGKDLMVATTPDFTLNKLRTMGLDDQIEIVTKICDIAGKEYAIEQAMDKMQGEWQGVQLDIQPYRESGTFVLKGFDVVQQLLDDHIVMTQSMSFSPFKGPFAQRIEEWERLLLLMADIFEEWIKCQRQWMYLEPIFSSDDIMRQLPTEGKRFQGVDRAWRKALGTAHNDPDAIAFCKTPRLLPTFQESNIMLDMVQKGLTEYLETKRAAFSRFYFLSNDELLEILSQSKDPLAVQQHLSKCFENIYKLEFQPDLKMTAMFSGEGERVPFKSAHYPEGSVEFWMTAILCEMKTTVQEQIILAEADYRKTPRGEWVLRWPGQTIIAGSVLFWTEEVEAALKEGGNAGVTTYYKKAHEQLMELTRVVSGKIPKLARKSLGALITIEVHARDVIGDMRDNGVSDITDFMWISQLRYELCTDAKHPNGEHKQYQEMKRKGCSPGSFPEGITLVKQVDACFQYGNEYLGNSMRLVITPLTDRIYLTLTGALQLYMGGAPAGPAGTGKTETTKDLAKALSKQCVVFNCSDQLDYIAMAKFFKGMAMSGAWACFDEFNRIDLEVLSVVAQQVSSVQVAMQAGMKRFNFEGEEIGLDDTNAAFITMNPGYAGRSELPDNLKCLFRPVACMVPNYAMIAEIRLYSFGYTDARRLSQKMVKTFQLSSEQLSSQDHYDFGMRAVNTVIQAAGNNRAANPDMVEDLLVLSALADSNKPKFLAEDMLLFNSILSDLFPGQQVPMPDYTDLNARISANCAKINLIPTETFLFKCIQIFEVSVLRHGFMTVGPSGGAKTCALHMLNAAMTDLDGAREDGKYSTVKRYILNPKAITMGQLYGEFDENTHEWTDGVLCVLYRQAVKEFGEFGKSDRQWIVFDGPVDAIWIESMNTVLDDNKKLCLVSGEIIAMSPYMNMVFEVEDLSVASPATVSRVGTIFMEPEKVVGTIAQIDSWILSLPKVAVPFKKTLDAMLKSLIDPMNEFSRKRTKEYVASVENNLTASTLNILHTFWTQFIPIDGVYELPDGLEAQLSKCLEKFIAFSVIWGCCATSDGASRLKLDARFRELLVETGYADKVKMPEEGLVFDYTVDVMTNKWVGWMTTIPEFKLKPTTPFADIIVPTLDSVRYMSVLERLSLHDFHVLCVGPTGTGKTLSVLDKLMSGMPDKYQPVKVGFSAQTSANQTQDMLDAKLDKRRKGIYGPPAGKKYVVFVDDVNMPLREAYGAQPPIEILRFWLGHGGWWDRKLIEWHKIIDMSMVGAMGPPGGGRQIVTNRFLRYFSFLSFPELSDASMTQIFQLILDTFTQAYLNPEIHACPKPMIAATLEIYNTLLKELLPTPAKSHYTFNLRDIASVCQGLLQANPRTCLEPADFIRLWIHENVRVYRDRLVNDDDRSWFDNQMHALIPKYFVGPTFAKADKNGNGALDWEEVVTVPLTHLVYGDFMDPQADPKLYTEITDIPQMVKVVEEYLDDFNATNTKKMPLVMFVDAVGHVARISRVIRQPMGNCLLLGVGGSGRQSVSRLAASMSGYDCFQIEITKTYGSVEWKDDLKKLLLGAGEKGEPKMFLFTDTQIVKVPRSTAPRPPRTRGARTLPTPLRRSTMTIALLPLRTFTGGHSN